MAVIEFDLNAFRAAFPAFVQTPEASLQAYWNTATIYINAQTPSCTALSQQTQYLNLMTAHLAALSCLVMAGETPGFITQATIDKISVTIEAPPSQNQWQWWLNLTPYGQQLLALLTVNSVGGVYVGGSPVQAGFRGSYGRFGY